MDNDFPAAHSMDSSWWAVDKNGNVALFITGAGGAMPNSAYSPEASEFLEDLDPDELEEMGIDPGVGEVPSELLPDEKTVFVYGTGKLDECLADRYHRKSAPKQPTHIDQLPPQARAAVGRVRLDTIDFGETEVLQPVELTECGTWDPAYLSGDGKTVKPVPGREKEYAEFHDTTLQGLADEGLTLEEPPKKKKRGKKKKKDED